MLRVVIADDEPLARRAMRRLLAVRPQIEIVGESESVAETLDLVGRLRPNLIFLDIRLNGGDGFDLLAELENAPKVVFVTAYAEYAVDAFGVQAVDYLLKPVQPDRLDTAIERVLHLLSRREEGAETRLELRSSGRVILAAPTEVAAVIAEGDFSRFILSGQPALLVLGSLGQFEAMLPVPPFIRLGRSIMVNIDRLQRVETRSRDNVRLMLRGVPDPISIGRVAAARLRQVMPTRRE
ncbi:LytR/AlgR family response regulator transcription factor [Ancylobacter oerskovii]|uniref:LytR/AlgR family response regulator transcription factor n=1 Tax=Ancylobacter oerskovii TaxID=459519 RepID=A0ABW4Z563_9HYPH|nr:LytTR family DNA-binding domain-containing protein [Ancylobacter oerskovii]MBS7546452.1 response regulator transcription factor [Ancylobacter oerskovii]